MSKGPFSIFDDRTERDRFALRHFLLGLVVGLLLASLFGCAPGRQFTRATVLHYTTESEIITSATTAAVGRYFDVGPAEAELTTGVYYDHMNALTYGLMGVGITLPTERVDLSGGVELLAPEDGGELEAILYGSVEVTWP